MIKCVFPNLVAFMAERGIGVKDLALAAERRPDTIRKKLAGVNTFDIDEGLAINKECFPDVDFKTLFSKKASIGKNSA